ncbi:MAG: hypothetical protein ACKVZH_14650 [Blastocatellia bacterium]
MKLTEQELKNLWRQDATRDSAERANCLSDELLLRAGLNELTETERLQITDHVADCSACLDEYRIARATNDWAKDVAVARDWQPIRAVQQVRQRPRRWLSFFDLTGFGYPARAALAAVLLIAAAVSVWTVKLQLENKNLQATLHQQQQEKELVTAKEVSQLQQNAEQLLASNQSLTNENLQLKEELDALAKPQLETPIIDVDPANNTRGIPTAVTRVEVPDATAFFTLILHLSKEPPSSTLLAELRDLRQDKVIWSNQVRKGAAPNLTLLLARRNLPAGKYRVHLSAVSQKRKTPLDQYELEVIYSTASTGQSKPGEIKQGKS